MAKRKKIPHIVHTSLFFKKKIINQAPGKKEKGDFGKFIMPFIFILHAFKTSVDPVACIKPLRCKNGRTPWRHCRRGIVHDIVYRRRCADEFDGIGPHLPKLPVGLQCYRYYCI